MYFIGIMHPLIFQLRTDILAIISEADDLQSVGGSVDDDDDEDDDFVWLCACDEPWVEVTVKWQAAFT